MTICWAERAIAIWSAFLFIILTLMSSSGTHGENPFVFLSTMANGNGLRFILYFIVYPWLFLRVIDFASGGPQKRRLKDVYPPPRYTHIGRH